MAIVTCKNCGNPVSDQADTCPKCGSKVMGFVPVQKRPENYLVWGVLATVLCCLPFGIVSIVKANSVNKLFDAGDYIGAERASQSAKTWAIVAAVCGIIVWIVYLILLFVGAISASALSEY